MGDAAPGTHARAWQAPSEQTSVVAQACVVNALPRASHTWRRAASRHALAFGVHARRWHTPAAQNCPASQSGSTTQSTQSPRATSHTCPRSLHSRLERQARRGAQSCARQKRSVGQSSSTRQSTQTPAAVAHTCPGHVRDEVHGVAMTQRELAQTRPVPRQSAALTQSTQAPRPRSQTRPLPHSEEAPHGAPPSGTSAASAATSGGRSGNGASPGGSPSPAGSDATSSGAVTSCPSAAASLPSVATSLPSVAALLPDGGPPSPFPSPHPIASPRRHANSIARLIDMLWIIGRLARALATRITSRPGGQRTARSKRSASRRRAHPPGSTRATSAASSSPSTRASTPRPRARARAARRRSSPTPRRRSPAAHVVWVDRRADNATGDIYYRRFTR